MDKQESLAYLEKLEEKGIILGLERIEKFLSLLGNPERSFKSVHIAGTNGKGSTAAMLSSILQQAGYKTGLYTSPHLREFNERIQVNGKNIQDENFTRLISELKKMKEENNISLTYFEFTTALAFKYFAEQEIDFAVVEVGVGGRLDATNVIRPEACAITNISLEHQAHLGNTLEKIAYEKAGIVKEGIPLITTEQNPNVLEIFKKICEEKNSKLIILDKPFEGNLPLPGKHQQWNAVLAIEVAKQLGLSKKDIEKGLAVAHWPARFEIIQKKCPIVLDVAHNPAGAKVLAETITTKFPGKKVLLVLGVASGKEMAGIAKQLAPLAEKVFVCTPEFRGMKLSQTLENVKQFNSNAISFQSVGEAVSKAIEECEGIVVVCGSHFTVGEALESLSTHKNE